MFLDNVRLSYPEARHYWFWKDWLGVNPQEVKVGGAIGVVLARVEGLDPHDWISLPLPTPAHLSRPTGGHQIWAWQRLCFFFVCALKTKWQSSVGKEQCNSGSFWCQLLAEPQAAGVRDGFDGFMANMLHGCLLLWTGCFRSATDPHVDSIS